MIKLTSLIKEWNDTSFRNLPKRWSNNKGLTEFEQQGGKDNLEEYGAKTSDLVGTPKKQFGGIYKMKEDMAEGKFDPKNPQVHIHGFGVYHLKDLEKAIARDLKECIGKDAEFTAMKLYMKHSTTEAKIKAANDAYKQMETPQYKRAVTMYKKKR